MTWKIRTTKDHHKEKKNKAHTSSTITPLMISGYCSSIFSNCVGIITLRPTTFIPTHGRSSLLSQKTTLVNSKHLYWFQRNCMWTNSHRIRQKCSQKTKKPLYIWKRHQNLEQIMDMVCWIQIWKIMLMECRPPEKWHVIESWDGQNWKSQGLLNKLIKQMNKKIPIVQVLHTFIGYVDWEERSIKRMNKIDSNYFSIVIDKGPSNTILEKKASLILRFLHKNWFFKYTKPSNHYSST